MAGVQVMTQEELRRPSIFSRLLRIAAILLAHSLALIFVLIALVKIVPVYSIIFEQQDVALPVVTQRIVMFSEFCVGFWFLMLPFAMVVDAAIVLILAFAASKKGWLLSAYSHLCLLAASAVLLYVAAWLTHPVYSLVR